MTSIRVAPLNEIWIEAASDIAQHRSVTNCTAVICSRLLYIDARKYEQYNNTAARTTVLALQGAT